MNSLIPYLCLAWLLFCIGVVVLLSRRSLFGLLLALLLMFHGSMLAWVAAARYHHAMAYSWTGLGLLAVLAAQFLIGLGVIWHHLKQGRSLDIMEHSYLKK